MRNTTERLRSLLARVRVNSPASFTWDGEEVTVATGGARSHVRASRDALVAQLEHRLYTRFYLTGGRRLVPLPPRPRPWLCELPGELTRANAGRPRLEPGWRVVGSDGPSLVLERDGLRVWARPDEIETRDGGAASLRTPVDLPAVSPGFHCARGETPERDESGGLDRFYWHLRPSGAVPFMRAATERLNRHGVPFFLKVIADPDAFGRADAGVLVLARRDRGETLAIVRDLHTLLSRQLDPPVPAFTKPLEPGLGFAQITADGTSFGMSRCRTVAQALVDAYERGEHSAVGQLDAVRRAFAEAGLNLDHPHLGPGAAPEADVDLPGSASPPAQRPRRPADALGAAQSIGRHLCANAIWHRGRCTWIGPRADRPGAPRVTADLGPDLHDGTSGVAIFLAELARVTGDAAARRTALGATRQALERRLDVSDPERGGLFGGWIGLGMAAAHVGSVLDSPELMDRGAAIASAAAAPAGDDLLEGRAGTVLGLVVLAGAIRDDTFLADALLLAHRLADALPPDGSGAAHGIAGIIFALDAASRAADDPALAARTDRLRAMLAARAADIEGISWCRGLSGVVPIFGGDEAGVALARFEDEVHEHLDARHPDLSLCHGMLGAADALVQIAAGGPGARAPLRDLADAIGAVGREIAAAWGRWPCGAHGEPPGLMVGLSGIGLGYLRLHDDTVLSPLALAPSRRDARLPSGNPRKEFV
jgi:hypothetical protein